MSISISQVRAARGLLGWSQTELAEAAGMSLPTVKRYETQVAPVSNEAIAAIRAALEAAGVEFIAENGGGPGVRLREKTDRPPEQGPVDAPMVRAGRKMKAEGAKRRKI